MGWSYTCDPGFSRADQIAEFRKPGFLSEGYELLESTVRGNHFWYLYRSKSCGTVVIGLNLIQSGGKNSGYGYKGMDESAGPYYYDCPLAYLDKASPVEPGSDVALWRQKVRDFHAAQKERKVVKPGTVVKFGKSEYTLGSKLEGRRGWNANRNSDGQQFRFPLTYLARSEIVSA